MIFDFFYLIFQLIILLFKELLLHWDKTSNHRTMPWKGIKDPYKIWISEIILQQTRVQQGAVYYHKLIEKYPTVFDLANANEQELFSVWQGLGYYSRCRNLHATAKIIVANYNGIFPNKHEVILSLKGIGDYTAAAIASFAYNLPHAVVDGNVVRVLSRIFMITENYHTTKGKKYFLELSNQLLDKKQPAKYNQAIMDFGATVCKPQNPLCNDCPFIDICKSFELDKINDFPIKKEKIIHKKRHFHFFVIEDKHHIYITLRTEKDIWQTLHTFYMVESDTEVISFNQKEYNIKSSTIIAPQIFNQTLSHQKITGYFYLLSSDLFPSTFLKKLQKIRKNSISQYAFPRIIISFFEKNKYL